MDRDAFCEQVASIARVPPELFEYQQWLQQRRQERSGERDYLMAESAPRFEPRKDDRVAALDGLEVVGNGTDVRLRTPVASAEIAVPGVKRSVVERLVGAIDGRRTLLEVSWRAEAEPGAMARFLRASFGRVILAPAAVARLEQQLPGTEIVRFPCAPYGIERPYWENMIDLRSWFEAERGAVDDAEAFEALLRQLHVIALMGRSLQSFYQPASPVADRTVAPGGWFDDPVRLERTYDVTIFLDGPRVNASLVGGRGYHEALYESADDPEALADDRALAEEEGLDWGRVVVARSQKDAAAGPWFCPPRPLEPGHFEALREALGRALAAATAGDREAAVAWAAGFHRRFVRLHPFHCANQSVAMNLVGAVLSRSHGRGIPHLVLDHLALRLSSEAYERVFARAVAAYSLEEPQPARRLVELQQRASRSFEVIRKLSAATGRAERLKLVEADPDGARFALLR
ncbi:MAG: hypothetical protein JRI23_31630 [Deltaproteobacteria bacterium]|jgi:hypothetical protein|nr:hypothetical protein [Deltaproteobacteria bacterium]MBW2536772.1 hypothetical protein [Deltaproteobacteria bacterium]